MIQIMTMIIMITMVIPVNRIDDFGNMLMRILSHIPWEIGTCMQLSSYNSLCVSGPGEQPIQRDRVAATIAVPPLPCPWGE
jgi:glucose uptake protein GlcU